MKTAGIIGGIGPESTVEYYRSIISEYRERQRDGSAPSVVINSIDVKKLLDLIGRGEFAAVTEYLLRELQRLARAGADFGALAANTPHIVFDQLQRESPLPLVSIVEATCDAVASVGLNRVALFGTKFTMTGTFYADVFSRRGIDLVVPNEADREYIHSKYVGELLNNLFLPDTREHLLALVDGLRHSSKIQGVVLGGTELPLLLKRDEHNGVRFFDTTKIHVSRIVAELLA